VPSTGREEKCLLIDAHVLTNATNEIVWQGYISRMKPIF
jgi:hypothetical protein